MQSGLLKSWKGATGGYKKGLVKEIATLASSRIVDSSPVLPWLFFVQTVSNDMIHCHGNVYRVATLFKTFRRIPLLHSFDKFR